MALKLDGLSILVPESRELDLFAGMLEAEGAVTVRCPLVQILDLDDTAEADRWIAQFSERPFDDLVLMTGEGLRRLLGIAARTGRSDALIAAIGKTRTVTRGPKPARALREIGLAPKLSAVAPTSQGVLDTLGEDIAGRRIGVQLYPGEGGLPLIAELRARGAEIFPVTPYRYASHMESAQVCDTIRALAEGRIGMVAFTSTPQIGRLDAVAREFGLEKELAEGLSRTPIASIGPVVEETLKKHGIQTVIQPKTSYHMKPMVQAIIAAWAVQKPKA